ncbi:MAG: glycerate kinase [Planctomycetes bacterium]|nr:glycerate kinase [Planctomycetota bacterium]
MVRPPRKFVVLCAPNAFKGSLTAMEAARAMARGVRRAGAKPVLLPVADGGDGTAAVLGGKRVKMTATGPYHERLKVEYRRRGGEAIVEVAQVGLARTLRRDPSKATIQGVVDMVLHAVDHGARKITIALGGSATVNAGVDLGEALYKKRGFLKLLGLFDVATLFLDAPRLFGPQKGASQDDVRSFERTFRHLARLPFFRKPARTKGSGAAGGIGFMIAALGGRLLPGADFVLRALHFDDALRHCNLVLTGEGKWDRTTREGKAPWAVMRAAKRAAVPCVALCGTVTGKPRGVRPIARTPQEGMRHAARLLEEAAFGEVKTLLNQE